MTTYRSNLPAVTKIRNHCKRTRKTPAITVNGSPIIGTQAKHKENMPYLIKRCSARTKSSSDILNHFFTTTKLTQYPNA